MQAPHGCCPRCLLNCGLPAGAADLTAPAGSEPADSASDNSPAPGTKIRHFGDYELLEQIGRGGMGVVYKARQVSLNRIVALKMIAAGELASPMMVQRFHIEAEAAAKLDNPNIVPIYGIGVHSEQHYFSMKFVEGRNLAEELRHRKFRIESGTEVSSKAAVRRREQAIAGLMATVARSVHYAHQHGVLHRDLKPSNILIDADGQPHLMDFGLAKMLESEISVTGSKDVMGTLNYMSPEQAAGARLTTATDIYSLGAILYELLTGHPPFSGTTPSEHFERLAKEEPRHPRSINALADHDLATVCLKCLEKDPHRRYGSANALAEDLERWLRKEPIYARPIGHHARLWRWCRRNPKVATLSASVFFLLLAVAVGATTFALYTDTAKRITGIINDELRKQVLNNLDELYADKNTESFLIPSRTRRALFRKRPVAGSPLELTFVEHIYEHPTNMLAALAPILDALEESMSGRMHRPIAIHMRLFKSPAATYEAVESTNFVFARMGPASYIYVAGRSNGARILVIQDHKKPLTMAVIVRADSDIARLQEMRTSAALAELLRNRTLALSHSNSTTGNFLAKRFLVMNGIYATHLKSYKYMGGQRPVFDAVTNNACDVGAGNLDLLDEYQGLRVLAKFEVPNLGRCWVAGNGLNTDIEEKLRSCLLEIRDPALLKGLESEVAGFKKLDKQALDQLRKIIKESEEFDKGNDWSNP